MLAVPAFLTMVSASPGAAATLLLRAGGSITDGTDRAVVFGRPGSAFVGKALSLSFIYRSEDLFDTSITDQEIRSRTPGFAKAGYFRTPTVDNIRQPFDDPSDAALYSVLT